METVPSLADIKAVTDGNSDGFGGNGAWWLIVLFLFAFTGWGGNGFGGGSGASSNYVLASDFATLQRQIDSATSSLERKGDTINAGLCDGFYAMNSSLLSGFAGVNATINTNGYETRNAITQAQIAEMQNANALQAQLANCCCENRAAIADLNYNLASQACAINTANASNTRDIIDNQNGNTRAILDALAAQQTEALKTRISEQQAEINALQLAASQSRQNSYLIDKLQPTPVPTFPASQLYGYYGNGCGCGCNNI